MDTDKVKRVAAYLAVSLRRLADAVRAMAEPNAQVPLPDPTPFDVLTAGAVDLAVKGGTDGEWPEKCGAEHPDHGRCVLPRFHYEWHTAELTKPGWTEPVQGGTDTPPQDDDAQPTVEAAGDQWTGPMVDDLIEGIEDLWGAFFPGEPIDGPDGDSLYVLKNHMETMGSYVREAMPDGYLAWGEAREGTDTPAPETNTPPPEGVPLACEAFHPEYGRCMKPQGHDGGHAHFLTAYYWTDGDTPAPEPISFRRLCEELEVDLPDTPQEASDGE
jgi:hypothetical protein